MAIYINQEQREDLLDSIRLELSGTTAYGQYNTLYITEHKLLHVEGHDVIPKIGTRHGLCTKYQSKCRFFEKHVSIRGRGVHPEWISSTSSALYMTIKKVVTNASIYYYIKSSTSLITLSDPPPTSDDLYEFLSTVKLGFQKFNAHTPVRLYSKRVPRGYPPEEFLLVGDV